MKHRPLSDVRGYVLDMAHAGVGTQKLAPDTDNWLDSRDRRNSL
jgi:hypothetical protein